MKRVGIICVGHTKDKFLNLIRLVENAPPGFPSTIIKMFNGKEDIPGAHHVPNYGWDFAMYEKGTELSESPWNIYLNDDVQHIERGAFDYMFQKMESGCDIVGAQPNLSAWGNIKTIGSTQRNQVKLFGRKIKFIRTHAFSTTKLYFNYKARWVHQVGDRKNNGDRGRNLAQIFEKASMVDSKKYAFLPFPHWITDSNTHPHTKGFTPYECG